MPLNPDEVSQAITGGLGALFVGFTGVGVKFIADIAKSVRILSETMGIVTTRIDYLEKADFTLNSRLRTIERRRNDKDDDEDDE